MPWLTFVAYFFGGVFLVNAVPHFTNGVSGRRFPTPFAVPLGKGESSPTVNVLWGSFNLLIGCLLVGRVGEFYLNRTSGILAVGVGLWTNRSSNAEMTSGVPGKSFSRFCK